MGIVKTPRATIRVLDSESHVTGYEVEYTCVYHSDGSPSDNEIAARFRTDPIREEVTEDIVAAIEGVSSDGLTTAFKAAHAQIADLQDAAAGVAKEAAASVQTAQEALQAAEAERDAALDKIDQLRKILA